MTRRLWVGFASTIAGTLATDAAVILALCNMLGITDVSPNWLILAIAAGMALLIAGWLCRRRPAASP